MTLSRFLFLCFLALLPSLALSQERPQKPDFDYTAISSLPIAYEGRILSLGSFAGKMIRQYGPPERYRNNEEPIEWLVEMIFDPVAASQESAFIIKKQSVRDFLAVEDYDLDEDQTLFSLEEIYPALQASKTKAMDVMDLPERTPEQNSFLALHDQALGYTEVMRSFSLYLPLHITIPEDIQRRLGDKPANYLNLSRMEPRVNAMLKDIVGRRGDNILTYTPEEMAYLDLSMTLKNFAVFGQINKIFRVIPGQWGRGKHIDWYSPWALLMEGQGSPASREYLGMWYGLADAYAAGDVNKWSETLERMQDFISAEHPELLSRLNLEALYNGLRPYRLAIIFYGLGLLGFLVTGCRNWTKKCGALFLSFVAYGTGALCHALGIAMRVMILERPPVATLYESLLFVSLICALIALGLFWKTARSSYMLMAGGAAMFLLAIAPGLISEGGDGLEVLSAVLNTNFWLGVHVLTITTGYAVCVIVGCLAHGYLIGAIKHPKSEFLDGLMRQIHGLSLVALLFTAVGTALGGVWADQSWGRFWGWDPKENGALLIVLWLCWLQHGNISGHFKAIGFATGMALLTVVVALAWFGVNLLSTGLHSYGFIDGVGFALYSFCAIELALIGGLWLYHLLRCYRAKRQSRVNQG